MRPQIHDPRDRVILALDVPGTSDALRLVEELEGLVSFYKVGLELLMAGALGELLDRMKGKRVFVDLKLPDDIGDTVRNAVRVASEKDVRFLTLSHSVSAATIQAAVQGRGQRKAPELLLVPFLSSQDPGDYAPSSGQEDDFRAEMLRRARVGAAAGADGFIVSGPEIASMRSEFPAVPIVSPGIRPSGSPKDSHKRSCTPAEAIRLGADYLVVGRPIRNAGDKQARRAAAQRIVEEIAAVS